MKKALLFAKAEKMYIEDLMTFEAIANALEVSERTVRNWAQEGNWETKRARFAEFQESLHDDAREIATLLAQKIKEQLNNGQEPANHLLFSFTRIASSLIKMRDYEKTIAADSGDAAGTAKTQKNAAEIFKQTFGVDLSI